jgi:hypothetical protein
MLRQIEPGLLPDFDHLVRTFRSGDERECGAQLLGEWVFGGE